MVSYLKVRSMSRSSYKLVGTWARTGAVIGRCHIGYPLGTVINVSTDSPFVHVMLYICYIMPEQLSQSDVPLVAWTVQRYDHW